MSSTCSAPGWFPDRTEVLTAFPWLMLRYSWGDLYDGSMGFSQSGCCVCTVSAQNWTSRCYLFEKQMDLIGLVIKDCLEPAAPVPYLNELILTWGLIVSSTCSQHSKWRLISLVHSLNPVKLVCWLLLLLLLILGPGWSFSACFLCRRTGLWGLLL